MIESHPPSRAFAMRRIVSSILPPLILLSSACSTGLPKGIEPVSDFDADRYLGTWHEIARLDHRFERGLQEVSATYARRDDGTLSVVNRGWNVEEELWNVTEGRAKFAEGEDTAWLEVSFFGPFYGTYAVFELDEDYTRAYVTGDDRSYLWFLSREPEVSPDALDAFRERATELGFDLSELIVVDQDAAKLPPPE